MPQARVPRTCGLRRRGRPALAGPRAKLALPRSDRMPAESVHFKVRTDAPLASYTAKRPGVSLTVWCNWEFDVYELSGASADDAAALVEILRLAPESTEIHAFDDALHVVVGVCSDVQHGTAVESIDEARCLHVPPARIHDGWEEFRMVSFSEERTRDVFAKLRK